MKKTDNQDNIKRIVNIIINREKATRTICITGMSLIKEGDEFCERLLEGLKSRGKKGALIKAGWEEDTTLKQVLEEVKKETDYVIVNTVSIAEKAVGMTIAAECDVTVLLIEKNKVDGNCAMRLKRELDMNHADVLGAVFIK